MSYTVFLIVFFLVAGAYWLSSTYTRRAMRSFRHAEQVEVQLSSELRQFIESEVPPAVARLAIQAGAITGCGCFVRSMLISHYLPRIAVTRESGSNEVQGAFDEAVRMNPDQQKMFGQIMGLVILYDGFRNPIQGWLFRRLLKNYVKSNQRWDSQLETRLATFSVVSRRYATGH